MIKPMPFLYRLQWILLLLAFIGFSGMPAFALEGRISDAESGDPLAGANVSSGVTGTTTDARGYFELEVVPDDSIAVSFIGYRSTILLPEESFVTVFLQPIVLEGQEVLIVSGLRKEALSEAAASVTVLDRRALQVAGGHHFQDLTQAVPNLNWAGGTSRPRYFQIRGIGERNHFVGAGPPNSSVGFVLDDVDLSGLGTAGILFDLDQLEVFKGPQSTVFGPNAMAGLISLQSIDPAAVRGFDFAATLGSDALQHYAGTVNLPVDSNLAVRLGFHSARSNGFRENLFLGADDSNRRREHFARAKVRYALDSGVLLLGTLFRADLDNGYDAWTPDNNEDLFTYSDNPGKDHQETTGFSFRGEIPLAGLDAELVSITAYSKTDLEYSFDGDWGNEEDFWRQAPYNLAPETDGWSNDFFDRTLRERTTFTQEVRLLKSALGGGNAIVGAYFKDLEESDDATSFLFGSSFPIDHNSTFAIDNRAFYGHYSRDLGHALGLALNLRLDHNSTAYEGVTADPDGGEANRVDFDVAQWLKGGKAALTYRLAPGRSVYGAVSRGYRAGGVNQHPRLIARNRPFDPEYITNLEVGWRSAGKKSTTALTLFHALRSAQQVNLSSQQNPEDPNSFFFFVANASKGRNSGIELEQSYRPLSALRLLGSLGYLKTHVDAYTFETAAGEKVQQGDRAAAHAPEYTLRLGVEYRDWSGFFGQLEWTAKDEFYFSDSHDQISAAYQLLNGRIGYGAGSWTVTLWGRNLFDERYAVRGFFFALEPPDWADKLYLSYGDPRQLGLSLSTDF